MLKKMTLMLILLSTLTTTIRGAEKYAVLLTGSCNEIQRNYWIDTFLMWEMLTQEKGYKNENVFVIFHDGDDWYNYEKTPNEWERYMLFPRYQDQGYTRRDRIVDFAATKTNIREVARVLRDDRKITEDDFLFIWTYNHGDANIPLESSCITLNNVPPITSDNLWISDIEFAEIFNPLMAYKKVYWMAQCNSGGFETDLTDGQNNVFFKSSCEIDEFAGPVNDRNELGYTLQGMENEYFNGRLYPHGEFNYHCYTSITGHAPHEISSFTFRDYYYLEYEDPGNPGSFHGPVYFEAADGYEGNSDDGVVSFEESDKWANDFIFSNEIQNSITSDDTKIGYQTTLEYPTILIDECDNPDSYIFTKELRGIIGVANDLNIDYVSEEEFFVLSLNFINADITLLANKNINMSNFHRIKLDNSIIRGISNNNIKLSDANISFSNNCSISNLLLQIEGSLVSFFDNTKIEITNNGILSFKRVIKDIPEEMHVIGTSNNEILINNNGKLEINGRSLDAFKITNENEGVLEIVNASTIGSTNINCYDNSRIIIDEFSNLMLNKGATFSGIPFGTVLNLREGSEIIVKTGSRLIIKDGASLNAQAGSALILEDGSEISIEDGSLFTLEEGARLQINGNAKITGIVHNILGRIAVTDNSKLTIGAGSNIEFRYIPVSSVILGNNSELIVESGATLNYGPSTTTDCGAGSKITVLGGGALRAGEYNKFNSTYGWKGIVAGVGSTVFMYSASIYSAEWGINAQAAKVNLIHTYFSDCESGVWLLNCTDYNLDDNTFDGRGTGTGIRVTESTGVIKSNTVLNHSAGIVAIFCSPLISENYLHDNATCGIALYGYNTYPQLLNPSVSNDVLNNRIINNGLTTTGENGSQIFMMYRANAYMNNGYNNIYSGDENSIPAVPCIKTVSDMGVSQQLKSDISQVVIIPVEYNYWGIDEITDVDKSSFFELWRELGKGYGIDYDPYATSAYEEGLPQPPHYSTNEPPTQEEQLLKVAMLLEENGVYKASIKKYETLIEKYPDSPEYYIATSRLPQVLAKTEESLEPLFATYDAALASDAVTNKKFIKQMKVSTKIKDKKYDEAIILAEQLKVETESDAEKNLCDIEIAICNMMKDAQNKNNKSMANELTELNQLLDDLLIDVKGEPAGITENILPKEHKLYQNYPNPFNPVTQIKFALAKTAEIKLSVYNVSGQKVVELASGLRQAGEHSVDFDGSRLNSGVYYYTLEVDGRSLSQKMIMMK